MFESLQVDGELNIPIYRQVAQGIANAIRMGRLEAEKKLPTVQEWADRLGIARGTMKRVYDELELLGLVEKRQGRGTFVTYRPPEEQSRKELAMSAIDRLLDELGAMGFTAEEAEIFLQLKLRQRQQQEKQLKVAVLECNPENLSRMAQQMRSIGKLDVHSYLTEQVQQYPYALVEDMDLIVTTPSHADFVEALLPQQGKLARVVLRLSPHCLSAIARLKIDSNLGVLCSSLRFGEMLRSTLLDYGFSLRISAPVSLTQTEEIGEYLKGTKAILLPVGYEKYCSPRQLSTLENYKGRLILCSYEMDEGSFLHLRERIAGLWQSKAL
ncbi:MAG: GntR family transcriptional regulator [Oscillospiraceae bacterium]|nr:GntR family transcriptional regulator [Oscillospiraceae bacterium]